jgi:hypothetical protein
VVDAVGAQEAPGVLLQHRDLLGRGNLERVDPVARHPGGVGVHRLVGELDALAVEHRQRGGHVHGTARGLGRDGGRELRVRGESPRAVDDHPHGQADLAADDGGLQFAVSQLDDLGAHAVKPQVGVAGPGRFGRRQCGFGELVAGQVDEVGIDPPVRCHGSTVTTASHRARRRPLKLAPWPALS